MDEKTELLRKLTADIQKEIGQAESIPDEQLERNIERVRALLRWLNDERDSRTADQSARARNIRNVVDTHVGEKRSLLINDSARPIPKRDAIVVGLEKVGVPSSPARIAGLVRELFGLIVSTSQFASFRKADERSYRRGPRNRSYIVPGLAAADLSGMARTVTLSDWSLERRIIGGYSQRADALRAIANAYTTYRDTGDGGSAAIMRIVARELPSIGKHAPDLDAMGKTAAADLEKIDAADRDERRAAALRAAQFDSATQLFGRAPLALVGAD
jgi:hypothetical protein